MYLQTKKKNINKRSIKDVDNVIVATTKKTNKEKLTKNIGKESTTTKMVTKCSPVAASLGLLQEKKCAHEKNHEYNTCGDRKYFTEAYYAKSGRMICCECEEEFGSSIKVNDKAPAYCCVNRFDKHNPCNHAYCHDCWMKHR
jgi:hypothetical protein